jgi:hypothetical protein
MLVIYIRRQRFETPAVHMSHRTLLRSNQNYEHEYYYCSETNTLDLGYEHGATRTRLGKSPLRSWANTKNSLDKVHQYGDRRFVRISIFIQDFSLKQAGFISPILGSDAATL